ncbi:MULTISPECIES: response regulator transcription factor [Proteiniclasticum]|uniref:Stage 0 sporulation protein A homolog n=1 Tax=Proteiniclasticum ruminis TaxID=398199 RepID=A0A1I4YUA0_9CLOT|nr:MULTISPECIES: response regulator transcription factor [Proteiniclasticum]SFN41537.1 DNA-binding response regulator, OmpR family, contains REC and winged-helix (wHTH) domain [Proteiniclasticum ruminis]HBW14182.1 DNA-binding response regulator [Proteiniclasticum sp.]
MEKQTILIVDDEKEIRDLIEIYLSNEGYETIKASNGVEALETVEKHHVDLIILDIMMPKKDGIQACMELRKTKNMPVIMLSAKSQDMDKILGLTSGADDYLTKPFNPLELIARVKSQLRRYYTLNADKPRNDSVLTLDDITININTREVKKGSESIKLTKTEFDMLEYMTRNTGIVLSVEKIYENVWKEEFLESENTVMVHIRKLREKIEDDPRNPRYIKTVWGVGYKVEK